MVSTLIRKALLSAALALPVVASAADNMPFTLASAVQLAVSQSRLVEAQRQQAVAAREMAISAGQLPDPVLKLGVNNLPVNGEDRFSLTRDFMTMRTIGVMQEFTRNAKRQARSARFQREAETAEAAGELTSAHVQSSTAMAWLDRYYQERALELLTRQKTETLLQVEAADAAYRGGRGSQSDVFAARTAVAQVEDRIAQTERMVMTAKSQLARWVGAAAEQSQGALPAMDVLRWHEADLDTQLQHHPQITVLQKQEAVALADADLARANKKSDWSMEVMASQRGSAYSDMVSVNFSVPLQWTPKTARTASWQPSWQW
jgi:outer membrane protein TolC